MEDSPMEAAAGPASDAMSPEGEQPDTSPQAGGESSFDASPEGLSKNQQKKLVRQQRFEERKAAKKAAEKEAKAARVAQTRAEVREKFQGMTEEEQAAWREQRNAKVGARRAEAEQRKQRMAQALKDGQRIVIDLDFEDQMTDAELGSLCQQLSYSYSANLRAEKPCHLYFTSFQGEMAAVVRKRVAGFEQWKVTADPRPYHEVFGDRRSDLVYLTADSPNELADLEAGKAYVIGGLVDRNRYKGLCYEKAVAQGVSTARLPIAAHVKLVMSHVLTVNHMVELLLQYSAGRDWGAALTSVIPGRKQAPSGKVTGAGDAAAARSPADSPASSPAAPALPAHAQQAGAPGAAGALAVLQQAQEAGQQQAVDIQRRPAGRASPAPAAAGGEGPNAKRPRLTPD